MDFLLTPDQLTDRQSRLSPQARTEMCDEMTLTEPLIRPALAELPLIHALHQSALLDADAEDRHSLPYSLLTANSPSTAHCASVSCMGLSAEITKVPSGF